MADPSATKATAPAKRQAKSKSKSPGPRNRNRNRSKSPMPNGQQSKGKSKSPSRNKGDNNRKARTKSPIRPKADMPKETPPPIHSSYFQVDGLLPSISNNYLGQKPNASIDVVLSATSTASQTNSNVPNGNGKGHSLVNSNPVLAAELSEAFLCDPALIGIVAEAKSTEFVPTRGRQPPISTNSDTKSQGQKKSPKRGKNGKSKSPGRPKKVAEKENKPEPAAPATNGRSRSPGPASKQSNAKAKSKSPVRPKKSKSPAPTSKNNGQKTTDTSTPKLPSHVQFDPCLVGIATLTRGLAMTSSPSINVQDRLKIVSRTTNKPENPTATVWAQSAAAPIIPPSYLEVEPLMGQMVPKEIAEAINLELSKKWDEGDNVMEPINETYETPSKPVKVLEDEEESFEVDLRTPPKDFKGKMAFFEKLTKQTALTPRVDPTFKVKAEVSEKVRSVHNQVRTSLGGGDKAINSTKPATADLPQNMTPLAEKRERVDKFFDKGEENVPKVSAASAKPTSTWAKVETAPPATFEPSEENRQEQPVEASTEPVPKFDELVSAMEDKTNEPAKPATNGKAKKGRSKSPRQNNSPKRKQNKSKSPVRSTKTTSEDAEAKEPAPANENEATPTPAEEKTPAPVPQEDEKPSEATPAADKTPEPALVEEQPTALVEEKTLKESLETDEAKAPVAPSKNGRAKSPRRKQTKSKSPSRAKKTASETKEEVLAAEPAPVSEDKAVPAPVKEEPPAPAEVEVLALATQPASKPTKKKGRSKSPRRKQPKSESPTEQKKDVDKLPTEEAEPNPTTDKARDETAAPRLVTGLTSFPDKGEQGLKLLGESDVLTDKANTDAIGLPTPETVRPEAAGSLGALDAAEEVHGELLSRDIATELLENSGNTEEENLPLIVASASIEEFPSLAAEAPRSPRRSLKEPKTTKSYARVLSEGKKLEQPGSIDLSKFGIPALPFFAAIDVERVEQVAKQNEKLAKRTEGPTGDGGITGNGANTFGESTNGGKLPAEEKETTNAEREKIEEMAQRLAEGIPQKRSSSTVEEIQSVEESKEDVVVDPGFTPIRKEAKKKKVTIEERVESTEQVLFSRDFDAENVAAENVVLPSKEAFRKNNFNPYSALSDPLGDIPPEIDTKKQSKKEKAQGSAVQSPPRKKAAVQSQPRKKSAVQSTKKKSGENKNVIEVGLSKSQGRSIAGESALEQPHFPPLLVLPLHVLNNIAHTKPFCYILDAIFWVVVLLLACPLGAVGIVLATFYKLLMFLPRQLGFGSIRPGEETGEKLAVVVTGCDSGFGKDLAFALMKEGFVVFCGCLQKESLKAFETEKLAIPVQMDITKDAQVDEVSKQVGKWLSGEDGRILHALVNNAGVGTSGLVDWIPLREFQKMMDVNCLGMVRCCKKFLPHFKTQAAEGKYSSARIVNMVSAAGLFSGGMFSVGYESSKHAAQLFSTNLRLETKGFGLKVTAINPSCHRTPMTQDMSAVLRKQWKSLTPEKRRGCGGDYIELACNATDIASFVINWDSQHVVNAMRQAVMATSPPARILVGSDVKYLLVLLPMLPTWFSSRLMSLKSISMSRVIKRNNVA